MCPKITTHLNYSLNITVLRIKVGLNDQLKCVYHGLSIIGEKLVFTFCDNKPKRNIYRSIYSGKSQWRIILFWYKECSTINATLSLSTTKCRFVIFDPCEFVSRCFSIGANCPSHLKNVTKKHQTESWENTNLGTRSVLFSARWGMCCAYC